MDLSELRVYNVANELNDKIWEIVDKWDFYKKDTIGKQMVRSVDSISANIAEGFGRYHFKENKNFLYYSRGSAYETLDWISKAGRRKIIDPETSGSLKSQLEDFLKSLNSYINAIGKKTPINQ